MEKFIKEDVPRIVDEFWEEGLKATEIKTHKAHEPNFKKAREF